MKERPILFNDEMVRALLDGRKTQTRRVAKLNASGRVKLPGSPSNWHCEDPDAVLACPYGQPGDRLWVRESFNWSTDELLLPSEPHHHCPERAAWAAQNVVWRADGKRTHPEYGKALWLPSIHMPRWASRILLEITNVRVERVQEISVADAKAEGVCGLSARAEFLMLWESINAKRGFGWDANPWVWVVEFRRIKP